MNERKSTRNHSNNQATNEQEHHISKADTQKDTGDTKDEHWKGSCASKQNKMVHGRRIWQTTARTRLKRKPNALSRFPGRCQTASPVTQENMRLDAIKFSEVRFVTHLRAICTVFTNAFERWSCALFISEVRFATHLREICTVFTDV